MTRWEVDLDAFAANLNQIRQRVSPATHMLVVKDDAYRHGLDEIIRRAVAENVLWFGAFDVATGVAVRKIAGAQARIFSWMATNIDDVDEAIAADLDLGVGTELLLEEIALVATADQPVRVHLKIDTGLHRNGVRPERWPAFVARAAELESAGVIRVAGIWTHIAEASREADDEQRRVFEDAVTLAKLAGLAPEHMHLAASAAAFERPDFRYDMVRIGAFAYGIRSTDGPSDEELRIRPIGALRGTVDRVNVRGAVVGTGFSSGLVSWAAGELHALTPVGLRPVAEVAAEYLVVADWPEAAVGDEVTIFGGAGESATDLAERIGTIGEEVILRLSPEVPRTYLP